ncbi:hypothetical protein MATL_G00113310 [Megalops atlanticus]|uniref:Uncharacterized protein n=1 Tax=Megalops atlanticus TaxID=7932 RepID=A0A9D3T651_MEGAT|nr:hypothetical protein MATL_G00113310 [Megalops atlanticus]
MKFSSWIFLWLMPLTWTSLAAHGNLPSGTDRPLLAGQGRYSTVPGLLRSRRQMEVLGARTNGTCSADELRKDPNKCCQKCPPGYHKKSSSQEGCARTEIRCSPCDDGSFTEIENTVLKCRACRSCNEKANERKESHCKRDQDTVCGCEKGYYKVYFGSSFRCEKCTECCSTDPGIHCGPCDFGQNGDQQKMCKPCGKADCPKEWREACQYLCPTTTTTTPTTTTTTTTTTIATTTVTGPGGTLNPPQYIVVLSLLLILLLGCSLAIALCFCVQRARRFFLLPWTLEKNANQPHQLYQLRDTVPGKAHTTHPDLPCDNHNPPVVEVSKNHPMVPKLAPSQDPSAPMLMSMPPPCFSNNYSCSLATPLLKAEPKVFREDSQTGSWPATVLYAIIGEVPVRRWKEFLRLLAVPDGQMERVELEAGPCYLEQQYQMLRLWSQRGDVGLENVYSALRNMDLSGCAQELQDKLEQLQQAAKTAQEEAEFGFCSAK